MNNVCKIINEIRRESSLKIKESILRDNLDNELLKIVLLYTYDGFKQYGLTDGVFNTKCYDCDVVYEDLFELLDVLKDSNINNNLRNTILINDNRVFWNKSYRRK